MAQKKYVKKRKPNYNRKKSRSKNRNFHKNLTIVLLLLVNVLILFGYVAERQGYDVESTWESVVETYSDLTKDLVEETAEDETDVIRVAINEAFDYELIPEYDGNPYVEVNNNIPYFTEEEITTEAYEYYGELDDLDRCTIMMACLGIETMPTDDEERGSISSVTPTGWYSVQYDCVEAGYVMNRCHCIGWALSAENANEKNLISGSRYLNIEMLEYESMVTDYIEETENHVMYRVTPIFIDDELLCRGLLMEGYSVEDSGEGVFYNVYFYNVQPGIEFDYNTGESWYTGIFLDLDASTVNYDFEE